MAECTATAADTPYIPVKRTRPCTETRTRAAGFTTVPAQRLGLSTVIPKPREDTLNPAARAAFNPARSAATAMVEKPGVIRHAEAQASVVADRMAVRAEADLMAADIGDRTFKRKQVKSFGNGAESYAADEARL